MEAESLEQLTVKYNRLIDELNKYNEIYSELVRQSREAQKGNYGFLDDRPDLKHGWSLLHILESTIFSLYLVIESKQDKNGECGVKCIGCGASYNKGLKRWTCQVTCECK